MSASSMCNSRAEEEEEDVWEPVDLDHSEEPTTTTESSARIDAATTNTTSRPNFPSRSNSSSGQRKNNAPVISSAIIPAATSSSSSDEEYRKRRMRSLREKLEAQSRLQEGLVNHPMRIFWSTCLLYLGQELWQLNWKLRMSLALLLVGVVTKAMVLSTLIFWYPRWFLMPALAALPFLYLHPHYYQRAFENFAESISSPVALAEALSRTDPIQLRRICLFMLLVPTVLEMRTLHFLSQVSNDGSSVLSILCIAVLSAALCYSYDRGKVTPHECTKRGLIVMYGAALLRVAVSGDSIRHLPLLLAPFSLATGVLLYSSGERDDEEWLSRAIRMALRRTLRDVLAEVGESVQQDEMLQLAMLRWIVDYWTNTTTPDGNSGGTGGSERPPQPAAPPTSTGERPSPPASSAVVTANTTLPGSRPEVQWPDLLLMLTMTTGQMESEVETLQQQQQQAGGSSSHRPASSASSTSTPPEAHSPSISSVQNLQAMLSNMDLDSHAKPAVEAYRRSVRDFPPSQTVSIVVSVARRCPALLTLIVHVWFGSHATSGVLSSLLLAPIVAFELLRVQEWSDSCQHATSLMKTASTMTTTVQTRASRSNNTGGIPNPAAAVADVDPMILLLSHDRLSLHQPPQLLVVWMNVCSSVGALQTGLTAVRCVQTTAVAVDFCNNLLSLAQLGFEVSQRGWVYGLAVLVKEFIVHGHHHLSASTAESVDERTKYTRAALSAVSNSRKMSNNFKIIMEEEDHVQQIFGPVVGFLSILVGRGWIWGRDEGAPPIRTPQSTVQIEELESVPDDNTANRTPSDKRADEAGTTKSSNSVPPPSKPSPQVESEEIVDESSSKKDCVRSAEEKALSAKVTTDPASEVFVGQEDPQSTKLAAPSKPISTNEIEVPVGDSLSEKTNALLTEVKAVAPSDSLCGDIKNDDQSTTKQAAQFSRTPANDKGKPRGDDFFDVSSSGAAIATDEHISESSVFDMTLKERIVLESAATLMSEVMELVASCAEQKLIDDSEKNRFFERLATMEVHNGPDVAWLEGTRCTLEGLLSLAENGKAEENTTSTPAEKNATGPCKTEKDKAAKDEAHSDEPDLLDEAAGRSNPVGKEPGRSTESSPETWEDLPTNPKTSSLNVMSTHAILPRSAGNASAPRLNIGATPMDQKSGKSETRSDQNSDPAVWAQVGGGLAVVGAAVVGGVALAMRNQGDGPKPAEQRRRLSHDDKPKPHHRHHHDNNPKPHPHDDRPKPHHPHHHGNKPAPHHPHHHGKDEWQPM